MSSFSAQERRALASQVWDRPDGASRGPGPSAGTAPRPGLQTRPRPHARHRPGERQRWSRTRLLQALHSKDLEAIKQAIADARKAGYNFEAVKSLPIATPFRVQ
jgi:hypothetical protein